MENRYRKLLPVLKEKHAAALLPGETDCRYFTGFDYTDGAVLILPDRAYMLTDDRYVEAATQTVTDMEVVSCKTLMKQLAALLQKNDVQQLYIPQTVSLRQLAMLEAALPVSLIHDGTLDTAICNARMVKSENELRLLREAQRLTEAGFAHILPFLKPGVTERAAALELEFFMRREGADGTSFDFIVISGANTSRPHGLPGDKPLENGDFVTMDFGALYHGYHADMTRTVAIGSVSDEGRQVYETVLRAQKATLSMLRAGVTGRAADAVARDVITAAGYGAYFGHGTGHGIGVEIHEAPRLSPSAPADPLPAGSVVTVEPGIYLPGRFGVRIEDAVVLSENGYENLTKAPKELIIL